jgi:hypothetical protein
VGGSHLAGGVAVVGASSQPAVSPVVTATPDATPPIPLAPASHIPTDEGARTEQLETLAALRDSGASTQAEFEAEKRRILDGR